MEQVFQQEVERLKQQGKTILLSSHILSEVERLADKVVIIRQGEVVESGTLEELRHLTRSVVTIDTTEDVSVLKELEGVYDFIQKDGQATFSVDSVHLNNILQTATQLHVNQLVITPPTLEDLFMGHYKS
ncbi:ABC-2 type transport system ATP-binding protein [Dolosicoccus paucivorans]|nr:ABC-2 type transport system ATP-binding protein [Dolosicoccus paucivorans]